MKKFFEDFKKFITRGSVIDLAVGVIIGGAFQKIVSSLVNDLIMPLVTIAIPNGLNGLVTVLPGSVVAADQTGEIGTQYWGVWYSTANVINWGSFVNAIINFVIIALVLFIIIKAVSFFEKQREELLKKLKKEQEVAAAAAPAPKPSPEILLLTEIRDLLKKEKAAKEETK
jgi:large conductance mechanosensitive channel